MRLSSVLFALASLSCSHPPPLRSFGTEAPLEVVEYESDGKWAVLCQSREDTNGNGWADSSDEASMYLVVGGGDGSRIDRYFGADPSGTWLAIVDEREFHFLNVENQTTIQSSRIPHFVLFSPAGDRALFGALSGEASWLDLVDFSSGSVWQLPVDPFFDGNAAFTEDLSGVRLGRYIRTERHREDHQEGRSRHCGSVAGCIRWPKTLTSIRRVPFSEWGISPGKRESLQNQTRIARDRHTTLPRFDTRSARARVLSLRATRHHYFTDGPFVVGGEPAAPDNRAGKSIFRQQLSRRARLGRTLPPSFMTTGVVQFCGREATPSHYIETHLCEPAFVERLALGLETTRCGYGQLDNVNLSKTHLDLCPNKEDLAEILFSHRPNVTTEWARWQLTKLLSEGFLDSISAPATEFVSSLDDDQRKDLHQLRRRSQESLSSPPEGWQPLAKYAATRNAEELSSDWSPRSLVVKSPSSMLDEGQWHTLLSLSKLIANTPGAPLWGVVIADPVRWEGSRSTPSPRAWFDGKELSLSFEDLVTESLELGLSEPAEVERELWLGFLNRILEERGAPERFYDVGELLLGTPKDWKLYVQRYGTPPVRFYE